MKWINVEERLPEVGPEDTYSKSVYITVETKYHIDRHSVKSVMQAKLTFNGVWVYTHDNNDIVECSRAVRVIGWMPLPEPMK